MITRSRAFAVVITPGDELGVYFIVKKTDTRGDKAASFLEIDAHKTPWPTDHKDALIKLLVDAGFTVRFYDPEEKQWMDQSKSNGSSRAPGNRDGSWGPPVSTRDFEHDYLNAS